jgi:membrane protease YdiL (CAAX protease family)
MRLAQGHAARAMNNMDSGEIPIPLGGDIAATEPKPQISRWRWWLHLFVLALFPLFAGVVGVLGNHQKAMLPTSVPGLIQASAYELLIFGVLFAIAWLASHVTVTQLLLKWRGGGWPLIFGFIYSVLLRFAIMIIVLMVGVAFYLAFGGQAAGAGAGGGGGSMRSQINHLVDTTALTQSPLYFALTLTLMSFVVAGFREELWRAAMLAGVGALFPRLFETWKGRLAAVAVVALFFGLGHTAQGVIGVGITGILGIGLGVIMLWHRSIWEAVIAHGFFDASTFAALYFMAKYLPATS